MVKGQPNLFLPQSPNLKRALIKVALGALFATILLNFTPSIVNAQAQQTPQATASALPTTFQLPHPGYLSQHFTDYHPGIDIATGLGLPIKPIAKGVITKAGYEFWGYGLKVEIDHGNGYQSLYAHLGKVYVHPGQIVQTSEFLGEVGLTGKTSGPHTHLEITKDGVRIDPQSVLPPIRRFPTNEDFSHQEASSSAIIESTFNQVNTYPTSTPKPLSPEDVSLTQLPDQPLFSPPPTTAEEALKLTEKLVRPKTEPENTNPTSYQGGRFFEFATPSQTLTKLSEQVIQNLDLNSILHKKSQPVTFQLSLLQP